MNNPAEIENIEEVRRKEGIEDIELRQAIRSLHVGDSVNLTFLTGTSGFGGETLTVRITSIKGYALRGKLTMKPVSSGLSKLGIGTPLAFTTDHIHSLPKGHSNKGQAVEDGE